MAVPLINRYRIALVILCAFFLTPFLVQAATISKPPNNLGLVGYWSFNEGAGTQAGDFSGRGVFGTLSGGPAWISGKRGSALSFDGTDDFVQMAVDHDSNSYFLATGNFTLSVWVRTSSSGVGKIMGGTGATDSYHLEANSGQAHFFYTTGSGGTDLSAGTINDGQWHHIVGVRDGPRTGALYVDGVLVGTDADATGGSIGVDISSDLFVGQRSDNTDRFSGSIDEVRVYSRALTASEVAALYGSGAVKFLTASKDLDNGSTLQNGLVGHYTFDGPDFVNTIADVSATNNSAYIFGGLATSTVKAKGLLGQALYLYDGPGDDYLLAQGDIPGMSGSSFTLSAWVKRIEEDTAMSIVSIGSAPGTGNEAQIELRGASLGGSNCDIFGTLSLSNVGDILPGTGWHLVTCTYDASTNAGVLYNDGVAVDSDTSTGDFATTAGVAIGDRFGGAASEFLGYIDDVRIYNRALTPTEVKQLYNLGQAKITP